MVRRRMVMVRHSEMPILKRRVAKWGAGGPVIGSLLGRDRVIRAEVMEPYRIACDREEQGRERHHEDHTVESQPQPKLWQKAPPNPDSNRVQRSDLKANRKPRAVDPHR